VSGESDPLRRVFLLREGERGAAPGFARARPGFEALPSAADTVRRLRLLFF